MLKLLRKLKPDAHRIIPLDAKLIKAPVAKAIRRTGRYHLKQADLATDTPLSSTDVYGVAIACWIDALGQVLKRTDRVSENSRSRRTAWHSDS